MIIWGGVVRGHLEAKDPVDHKGLREIRDQVVLVDCVDLLDHRETRQVHIHT